MSHYHIDFFNLKLPHKSCNLYKTHHCVEFHTLIACGNAPRNETGVGIIVIKLAGSCNNKNWSKLIQGSIMLKNHKSIFFLGWTGEGVSLNFTQHFVSIKKIVLYDPYFLRRLNSWWSTCSQFHQHFTSSLCVDILLPKSHKAIL